MMMIMVYALHDEKEEREILKKIKILFILIKGTSTVLFYSSSSSIIRYIKI